MEGLAALLGGLVLIGVGFIIFYIVAMGIWLIFPYVVMVIAAGFLIYFAGRLLWISTEEAAIRQRHLQNQQAARLTLEGRQKELDDLYARAEIAWERKWQEKLSDASGAMPKLLPKPSDYRDRDGRTA